jgi:hypothetical protein
MSGMWATKVLFFKAQATTYSTLDTSPLTPSLQRDEFRRF